MTRQTGADLLPNAITRLKNAGVPDPARDARRLLSHALGCAPDRLLLHTHDKMSNKQRARFDDALAAREARQPVSHILGFREFFGRNFDVNKHVLDPRPETETLVEEALKHNFQSVLDLGTGSGAILLSLLAERPQTSGVGVDISEDALSVAKHNAAKLGLEERVEWLQSDWLQNVDGRYDLIVCNPPYIDNAVYEGLDPEPRNWEPRIALTPGEDGLQVYRVLAPRLFGHLKTGGRVLFEIGYDQGARVSALLSEAGFGNVGILQDLDTRDRVVWASI